MPIKYNNFDIGNAYLGNDNLVAMYQGSNLVWTNGIKLKVVNNVIKGTKYGIVDLGTLNYDGFQSGDLYAIASYQLRGIIKSSGVEHTANIYVEGYEVKGAWYSPVDKCVKVQLDDGTIYLYDSRYSSATDFKNSLKGNYLIYELSQPDGNNLSNLNAQQLYDLLTLNGTDFTNLELLASGYEIKLGSFKSQETNTVDLGDLRWGNASSNDNVIRVVCSGLENRLSMSGATLSPNNKISYVDYALGVSDSEVNHLSTKTYSYFVYIVLSKSAIGWTDSEGDTTLNTKVQNYLRGIKLTYELANKNNIAGSKYSFVKMKDMNWYQMSANDERFYSYTLQDKIKKILNIREIANVFTPKYTNVANIKNWDDTSGLLETICVGADGFVGIRTKKATDKQGLINSFDDNDILIYEVENSLGNKLDNYTAEQVYYMFFATLGMNKMYVPYGKRFESSDNIILGTKYGIANFSNAEYVISEGGTNRERLMVYWNSIDIQEYESSSIVYNFYVEGYKSVSGNETYNHSQDKIIALTRVNAGGGRYVFAVYIYDTDLIGKTANECKNILSNKYIIYGLKTPNGTDYSDLTAKEMYDVINDNAIDILANGKSVDGIRNIFGKFNNIPQIDFATYENTRDVYISKNGCDHSDTSKLEKLNVKLYDGHKYFIAIGFKNIPDNKKTELWNCLLLCDSNGDHIIQDRYYIGCDNNVFYTIAYATRNAICDYVRFYDNTSTIAKDELLPTFVVAIDLDENNIQIEPDGYEKTNKQKCYQYFKENNLFKMTTTGVINIGGLKK